MNVVPQGPGSESRQTQGVGGSARTPRPAGERRGSDAPGAAPASSLYMSAAGERFLSLRSRLEGLDLARPERVERLRQAVASGNYAVGAAAIAAAMLDDPATAAALGMK